MKANWLSRGAGINILRAYGRSLQCSSPVEQFPADPFPLFVLQTYAKEEDRSAREETQSAPSGKISWSYVWSVFYSHHYHNVICPHHHHHHHHHHHGYLLLVKRQ